MKASPAYVCTPELQQLEREWQFARHLARRMQTKDMAGIFAGATNREIRRARARAIILEHDLAARRIVSHQPDTYADCFERLYREPLVVPRETTSQLQLEVPV